ncbi:protein kinase domain-containing protein [Streptacidiphilus sp. PAMC 29251]
MADNEHADGGNGMESGAESGTPADRNQQGYQPGYQSGYQPGYPPAPEPPFEPAVLSTSGLAVFGEGRYQLTGRLGRGGMAEVFAARDVRLGRTVAIKVLRSELAEDATARIRFTREAHSVASLNHHAVVAVYDTGEEAHGGETVPYIVMELVEGHTVRELLQGDEPPPVDQALIITAGILEALAYSHRHGIVHRDIKPANVIITNTGAVKVMDFGIARALTGATSTMTQTGMVMGTPQYLSPEQALGKAVDHRSDLYATGCMLYELLTLRPPFTGDTPLSVVYQHVQDAPVPPSQANSRVPASLDPLVLRSLAKDPDDRFQSADEFRAHLQHALRTMHHATGPTELLPSAAAGAAAAAAMSAPTMATRALTPPMGSTQAMPPNPGSAVPPRYDDRDDRGDDGHRSRRGLFAVIAVLVAIAAISVGVALAMRGSSPGTPGPVTSSSVSTPAEPTTEPTTDTPTVTESPTPTESPTQSYSPTPSPTHSKTVKPTPTNTATATKSATASPTPSTTPSSTATPSGNAGGTAGAVGGTGQKPPA